ncbi:MAG: hypothetical protein ACK4RW_04915 [Rehaibacterium terrae]|uniref:hypothetical protein n=1 Tax=Rehaibacterium terrae TaxID=1341696 RepID=UPI00391B0E41
MHTDDPRKEAHDAEERALARIVRALSGGGPSSQLDAAVLAAARAAVERDNPRRRLSLRWGFGASAAAMLAVALFWQWQRPDAPLDEVAPLAPALETVPAPDSVRGRAAADAVRPQTRDIAPPAPAAALLSVPDATLPPPESDESLAPADWIARIRERLAAGQADDARRSLRRFIDVHPDHPLPDDLRALAE